MSSPGRLVVLALAALLAACGARTERERDGESGTRLFRYANGNRWSEVRFEDGRPHGVWRAWWPDGSKKSVETWVDGHLDGPFESWFENGKPMVSGTYQDDRRHGPWRHWHADGTPEHEAEYANGEPTGTSAEWFENGHPKTRSTSRDLDGAEEIVRQMWYEDGGRRFDGRLVDGLLDGPVRFWNEDGRLDPESGVYERSKKVAELPAAIGE